jgi:hypothetical protein
VGVNPSPGPVRVRLAARLHPDVPRRCRARRLANSELAHAAVVAEMKRFLPIDELQFLMELSIEPIAAQLGLTTPAT